MCFRVWPKDQIDHKDGDRSNNAISNLRECTPQQNQQNRHKFNGRSPVRGRWRASIVVNKKSIYLGSFATKEQAELAYLEAKPLYHPFWVNNK